MSNFSSSRGNWNAQRPSYRQTPYLYGYALQNGTAHGPQRCDTQRTRYSQGSEQRRQSWCRENSDRIRYYQHTWRRYNGSRRLHQSRRRGNCDAIEQNHPDIDPNRPDQRANGRSRLNIDMDYDTATSMELSQLSQSAQSTQSLQSTQSTKSTKFDQERYSISSRTPTPSENTTITPENKSVDSTPPRKNNDSNEEDAPWDPEKEMPLLTDLCRRQSATLKKAGLGKDDEKTDRYYECWLEDHEKWVKDYGEANYRLFKRIDLMKGFSCPETRGEGFFGLITEDSNYTDREHEMPEELLDRIAQQVTIIGEIKYEAIQAAILEEARLAAPW